MPSEKINLSRVIFLLFSIALKSLSADFSPQLSKFLIDKSEVCPCFFSRKKISTGDWIQPKSYNCEICFSANPSIEKAFLETKCLILSITWDLQDNPA